MDEFRDCNDIQHRSKYKHQRTIIHIDLDCFYAQVEMLKNPDLFTKPVGIKQQHYVITSNYVAREYGVQKCMLISEALALCPNLIIINGEDLHDYRIMSSKVTDVIRQFSSKVEKLGLDENFVDVSDLIHSRLCTEDNSRNTVVGHIYQHEIEHSCSCGCRNRLSLGSHIASEIRERIKEELGLTSCAGIAHNKLLAKLVGPTHKPNQQTTVFPCAAMALVSNLNSIRGVPGIGRKTSDILEALGVTSMCDAQNCSIDTLEKHLGKALGSWVKGACFGVDDTDVKESGKQQVIGLEEAAKMIGTMEEVSNRLKSLIDRGMVLLQEDGRFPTTVRVAVRKYSPEEYVRQRETKQCSINPSLFRASTAKEQIFEVAISLFKKLVDCSKPFHLTLIGLAFTKFQVELPPKSSLFRFIEKTSKEKSNKPVFSTEDNKSKHEVRSVITELPNMSFSENEHFPIAFEDLDKSVMSELPEDIRLEVLQSCSQQVFMPGTSLLPSVQNTVKCPPGVDEGVFNELPHEIKLELIKESNNASKITATKDNTSSKKQNSILNYLKK